MPALATCSVAHSGVFRAAIPMQFMQPIPDFKADTLAAFSARQVGDMRLRDPDQRSDFVLVQAGRHQIQNDFFPHDAHNSICCREDQQQPLVQHLLLRKHNAGMEIEEVRRLRLRQWIDIDPVSLGDVEKWCEHYSKRAGEEGGTLSPTYIRQLVPKRGKASRNIGERSARRLERIVGKPKGSLDEDLSVGAPTVDHVLPARQANAALDNLVDIDVVQSAIVGVLDAFGLRYEDLVGDAKAARVRIAAALSRTRPHSDMRMRFLMDPSGEVMPRGRPTRMQYRKQFHGEIFPDRSIEQEGRQADRIQERRS